MKVEKGFFFFWTLWSFFLMLKAHFMPSLLPVLTILLTTYCSGDVKGNAISASLMEKVYRVVLD